MSRKKVKNKKKFLKKISIINKLINYIMIDGKKNKALYIINKTIFKIYKNDRNKSMEIFKKAINNIKPRIEVKSKKIGGSNYQIPTEINIKRSISLALKWLILYSKKIKSEKNIINKLKKEIINAYNRRGLTYKKKEDIHKIAEANKAFAHYK